MGFEKEPYNRLGSFLKQQRDQRYWTQMELCTRASLSLGHVSMFEKGWRHPRRKTSDRLAYALEIDPDQMWDIVEESRRESGIRQPDGRDPESAYRVYANVPLEVDTWLRTLATGKRKSLSGVVTRILCRHHEEVTRHRRSSYV